VLSLAGSLAECMVLCGKVADPGWPVVGFGVGDGGWFGRA
jgi:hypothetical protein